MCGGVCWGVDACVCMAIEVNPVKDNNKVNKPIIALMQSCITTITGRCFQNYFNEILEMPESIIIKTEVIS